nr:hypothetical protein [Tanacetum cinerariifolium]
MDITIDQQVALDEALVPHASRLRIGKTDVPEIYMQEFWATAKVQHHSIRFKMNNKKRIVNLEYFREMLQISSRIPNQQFDELPFEEEILAFLRELGQSGEINMIIDVNINKLHQPWRSFAAVINKCLSGKSTGYDSLCLSQAKILWGMYHKKNMDFAYLLWEAFWATATVQHHSICFKMNNTKRIVNLEYFREMLQIYLRIPNQQFDELPFEEEILAFLRELGQSGEIKMIINVNINKLHQPWRLFAAVINKCLSGKSTGYDSLRLSQAQILWGIYHKKNVDFAYLLWEDFVYQVEHKDAKKNNEMYYPRFTKVIVNFFMTKDQSIPRRNKYGVILPVELTNEAIRNSKSYKEYYAITSGAKPPKTKASVKKKQSISDTTVPPSTKRKRLNILAKVDKPAKEKQPAKSSTAKGLTVLSEVALTEDEQIKLATKRSLTQTHISHASGSIANEGTGIIPGIPDGPDYESDDEEISWKSSEEDDDKNDDEEKICEHDDDDDDVDDQSDDDQEDQDDDDQDDHDDDDDELQGKYAKGLRLLVEDLMLLVQVDAAG